MITIKNERLEVKMAEPNEEMNTCRFNRAGFIFSAVLDGKTEFCGDEHGGSGGYGMCSEIVCDPLSENAAIGERFPKYGVGLLKKENEGAYMFMNVYETEPHEISKEVFPDKVIFTTAPKMCGGFALSEKKTVSVKDNVLRVDYEITNAGEKELDYREYVHNFITLDYEGKRCSYNLTMQAGNATVPYSWQLAMGPARIVARDFFDPWYHNIWSPGFVISPEVYFRKVLQPGEKAVYVREWEFYAR